jgi:hypothetical protein
MNDSYVSICIQGATRDTVYFGAHAIGDVERMTIFAEGYAAVTMAIRGVMEVTQAVTSVTIRKADA